MPRHKLSKISKVEREFADLVENNDTSKMIDRGELVEVKDIKVSINPKRPRKIAVSMKVYPVLLKRVKQIAAEQQMPYQLLIQQWIAERVYLEEQRKREAN